MFVRVAWALTVSDLDVVKCMTLSGLPVFFSLLLLPCAFIDAWNSRQDPLPQREEAFGKLSAQLSKRVSRWIAELSASGAGRRPRWHSVADKKTKACAPCRDCTHTKPPLFIPIHTSNSAQIFRKNPRRKYSAHVRMHVLNHFPRLLKLHGLPELKNSLFCRPSVWQFFTRMTWPFF